MASSSGGDDGADERYGSGRVRSALHAYFSLKMIALVLAFVAQIVIVKTLVPQQYATYAILIALVTAGERALSFGVDRAVTRFVPQLTGAGDLAGVDAVIRRTLVIRLVAIVVFGLACAAALAFGATLWLPAPLDPWVILPFAAWFLATALMADADAYAQSWLAHRDSARATLGEIVLRMAAVIAIVSVFGRMPAIEIVCISAVTQTLATTFVIARLVLVRRALRTQSVGQAVAPSTFNPAIVPSFALANFASTVMYLISSPPVIRLVASGGLSVVALAAYSFVQTLALSLQRLLPGMSILPSLEPFAMSGITGERRVEVLAALSLVFKIELVVILCGVIATALFGHDLILLLSRPEYAEYYFVLPLLLVYVVFATGYRLLEIMLNAHLAHRIFFWVWPLGLLASLAIALTVGVWGVWSVLLIPIAEIALRVVGLSVLFRRLELGRVFDLRHTLPTVLAAAAITAGLLALRPALGGPGTLVDLCLAVAGVFAFLAALAAIRPIRAAEIGWLKIALPSALGAVVRPVEKLLVRPGA